MYNWKQRAGILGLLITVAVIFALSLLLGRYPAPGLTSLSALQEDPLALMVIRNLRLPRTAAALLLGCSLGAAGAVFQMIFSNPLVEPGFLGVSQGAAFGAALSIVAISSSPWVVQLNAAVFAFLGLGISYTLARRFHFGGWILRLILAGIAVSALFSAGVGVLKYAADPFSQLPEITFWMLGGLWGVTEQSLFFITFPVLAALLILLGMRWRLNILTMDDRTAFSLGSAPGRERILLLTCATVATSAVISVSGVVSWVGLIVPHIARRLFTTDARYSIPASMLIGGAYVLICDALARTALEGELPLGVLTSLFGALLFIVLLSSKQIRKSP